MDVKGDVVYLEYEKVCRTCLAITELQPLFAPNSNSLANMIMTCTSVQIQESDGFPMNICNQCINEITQAFNFKTRCESIDQQFHFGIILNSNTIKQEVQFGFESEDKDNLIEEKTSDFNLDSLHSVQVKVENSEEKDGIKNTEIKNIPTKRKNKNCATNNNKIKEEIQDEDRPYFKIEDINHSSDIKNKDKVTKENIDKDKKTKVKNKNYKVKCTVCEKEITYRCLDIHMRSHTKEKPFSCKECGRRFTCASNLKRHTKIHTGEKPYQCVICGRRFIQAVELKVHLPVHTTGTPYGCDICGKKFKHYKNCQSHKAIIHLKTKTAVKRKNKPQKSKSGSFACDFCDRRFQFKLSWRNHREQHINGKAFLCSVCGKSFSTKHYLESHQNTHSGAKPFSCNICNKSFGYKSSLYVHNFVHTGEKKYSCTICGKKFRQSQHLNTHLHMHEGVKTHVCSFCGKSFFEKGNLTVHVRIHTGETPYVCSVCKKGFHDSRSWKKHECKHKT